MEAKDSIHKNQQLQLNLLQFFFQIYFDLSKEALHTLSLFIDQLDSEAYVVRMAMVEVIGVLIYYLMTQEDRSESVKAQTKSLFAALEERFMM